MANFCGYDMRIAGPVPAVQELVEMLQHKNPPHVLGRVFSFDLDESLTEKDPLGGDFISVQGFGDCANSVHTSMCIGSGYDHILEDETKRLGLVVEVYSSDPDNFFQEHLLFDKGFTEIDETVHYEEYVIDGASEEFIQDLLQEKNITREELMAQVNHNGEYCVGGFEDYCEFKDLFSYFEGREKPSLASQISKAAEKKSGDASHVHSTHDKER